MKEILAFKIGPSYEAHKGSGLKQECVKFNREKRYNSGKNKSYLNFQGGNAQACFFPLNIRQENVKP